MTTDGTSGTFIFRVLRQTLRRSANQTQAESVPFQSESSRVGTWEMKEVLVLEEWFISISSFARVILHMNGARFQGALKAGSSIGIVTDTTRARPRTTRRKR